MQAAEQIKISRSNAKPFAFGFALSFLAFCVLAAIVIGAFPLAASLATIFLFAGVHNLMEFRYFVARMPARWGKSKSFYLVGIGGVSGLTVAYLSIYFSSGWLWSGETSVFITASWNTGFMLWLALLFYLRGQQKPRADWIWAFPAGLFAASLAWLAPHFFALALVYLHPLVALWFFERQLRRTKPQWLKAFHFCLASLPVFLAVLWLVLANTANLPEDDFLQWRIAQHAGSEILTDVSSRFLVAAHVFLETIHYSVWILLIPLVDKNAVSFGLRNVPLIRRDKCLAPLVCAVLAFGLIAVFALWFGFAFDYAITRDVYFAFAIAHVLAEFPFLIKML